MVAEAKNALVNLSPKLIYLRVFGLLYSNINIRIAPPIKRIAVIIITTLECNDNFLYPLKLYNSDQTVNPKPPITIKAAIVNITVLLLAYPTRLSPNKSNPALQKADIECQIL